MQFPPANVREDGSSNPAVSGGCPPEKSAITTLTGGIKQFVSYAIEHTINAEQIIREYASLKNLLEQMTESERREVEPLVEGMILAWHERRKNEKTYLDRINHEVKDMLKTYLDRIYHEVLDMLKTYLERIYHEVLDMLKTYLERWNHESRESARPQSEEDEGIKLSAEDMGTLVLCFNGDRETALKFLNQLSKIDLDRKKTDLVNMYVRAGKIKDRYKHRELWKLLSKNGLYNSTETNWNKRIF